MSSACFLKCEKLKAEAQDPSHTNEEEEKDMRGLFQSLPLVAASPAFALQAVLRCGAGPARGGRESLREPGHEWCLGGARAAAKEQGEKAERSSGKGLRRVLQRKAKNPWRALLDHGGGKKAFLPAGAGHERPSWWCKSSSQEGRPKGLEELGQVVVLNAAEEGEKPVGSSASVRWGKIPS